MQMFLLEMIASMISCYNFDRFWLTDIIYAAKNKSLTFQDIMGQFAGFKPTAFSGTPHNPWVAIPKILQFDMGFSFSVGFGWKWKDKEDPDPPSPTSFPTTSMDHCPIAFMVADELLPNIISANQRKVVIECCTYYVKAQQVCDKSFAWAHQAANEWYVLCFMYDVSL